MSVLGEAWGYTYSARGESIAIPADALAKRLIFGQKSRWAHSSASRPRSLKEHHRTSERACRLARPFRLWPSLRTQHFFSHTAKN
jgi:hypothetical protein